MHLANVLWLYKESEKKEYQDKGETNRVSVNQRAKNRTEKKNISNIWMGGQTDR